MSFWPDPDDERETPFERYDIIMLAGQTLIAWALAVSVGIALYLS